MPLIQPCNSIGDTTQGIVVDIMGNIAAAMQPKLATMGLTLNYEYGRSIQVLKSLQVLNNGIKTRTKYPLLALFMPFKSDNNGDYYVTVKFPKIVIAVLSNNTDTPSKRYNETFKPILYPVYNEFIKQISRCPNVLGLFDSNFIPHKQIDNPGSPPPVSKDNGGIAFADFVDAIEIYDLELTFQLDTY